MFNRIVVTTLLSSLFFNFANCNRNNRFTPLQIDHHPCKPELLRRTNRYVCDTDGNIICQPGWQEPQNRDSTNLLNPCLEPICDHNGLGCVHGECRAPDYCACEVGWEGANCNDCVRLPGCDHGTCRDAFECKCQSGWEGAFCDIPICDNCTNGYCNTPNQCNCLDGWFGENCRECQPMVGCQHGHCGDHPYTCVCDDGWDGHLCDKPRCPVLCQHGFCHAAIGANRTNYCICHTGWRGEACDKCSPYWECPNQDADACNMPNECFCFRNEIDNENLCNNTLLISQLNGNAADLSRSFRRRDYGIDRAYQYGHDLEKGYLGEPNKPLTLLG